MLKTYRAFCFPAVYLWKTLKYLPAGCMYDKKYFRQNTCSLQVCLRMLSARYMQFTSMLPKPFDKVHAVYKYASETFRQGICSLQVCLRNLSTRYMQITCKLPNTFDKVVMNGEEASEYFRQASHD